MSCPKTLRLMLASVALIPTPACADHTGPGGGTGASGPINTISAGTLEKGHWAVGLRFLLVKPRYLSDAELLSRSAEGIDAHGTDYVLNSDLGAAVGLTDDLSLSAELPFVRRHAIREGDAEEGGVVKRGTSEGVGDLNAILKYRAAHGANWSLALLAGVKMPTGNTRRRDRQGVRFETEHQPGTGSWDPIVGLAMSHGFGPNSVDASMIYQVGTHGALRTRLGDRAQAGIAFSHRFWPTEHHVHDEADEHGADEHHHDHHHDSLDGMFEVIGDWEGRENIAGVIDRDSGGRSIWLSPGARFTSASGWSIAGSFGLPVSQHIRRSHPENAYRFSLSLGRNF
jgi:hypothetical protein